MARKKKTQQAILPETINYQGNVTLKIMQGGKVLQRVDTKNTGTKLLLQNIANYLLGNSGTQYNPHYMGVGTGTSSTWTLEDTALVTELSGTRVPTYTQSVREKTNASSTLIGYIAPFSATFPFELIGSNMISEIGLFSGSTGDNCLARIQLSTPQSISEAGMSLVVEWEISITNA